MDSQTLKGIRAAWLIREKIGAVEEHNSEVHRLSDAAVIPLYKFDCPRGALKERVLNKEIPHEMRRCARCG